MESAPRYTLVRILPAMNVWLGAWVLLTLYELLFGSDTMRIIAAVMMSSALLAFAADGGWAMLTINAVKIKGIFVFTFQYKSTLSVSIANQSPVRSRLEAFFPQHRRHAVLTLKTRKLLPMYPAIPIPVWSKTVRIFLQDDAVDEFVSDLQGRLSNVR